MKTRLLILFVILSSLTSCSNQVPNIPICIELTINKGYCVWTIGEREQMVDDHNTLYGKTWWEQRNDMLRLPIQSWVELKKFILKSCEQNNNQGCKDAIKLFDLRTGL